MLSKLQTFVSSNKREVLILITILFVAAFFRFYKIADYMTFLGDEGRDMIVAKGILSGDFTLLGPRASAGDFFLGPAYYYMIAPFLLLANYDPVGPSIMVAIFGVLTVFFVYFFGRKFFNSNAGLIASSLYAISPLVVAYSRSSWNPNLMPFISILIMYFLYKSITTKGIKNFLLIGVLLGIAIQLHYLTVFIGVIVFLVIVVSGIFNNKKNYILSIVKQLVIVFCGFLITLSPFLLFELKHGFPNSRAIFKFIFFSNNEGGYPIGQSFLGNFYDVFFRLFGRLVTKFPPPDQVKISDPDKMLVWQILTIALGILSVLFIYKVKDKYKTLILCAWLFLGVFLFSFYKKPIYDYYLGFIFPLPFLLVGNFLSGLIKFKKLKIPAVIFVLIIFIGLLIVNFLGAPFFFAPNKQKDQAKKIAEVVISKTGNKPYNFALVTKGNSDHVYRYFLEVENRAPITILNVKDDPLRKSVTSQLMIVCEYSDCHPLGDSLWEIAGFGRAEIAGEWKVPVGKVMRLIHYKEPSSIPKN